MYRVFSSGVKQPERGVGNPHPSSKVTQSLYSSDLLHILLSFRSGRSARFWIVPDVFPTLLKLLWKLACEIDTDHHTLLSTNCKFLWQIFQVL